MAPFLGLKGRWLHAAVWMEACFGVVIFGYNQAAAGGVLTTPSFNAQFPQIDTLNTTGEQKHYNSTIQGEILLLLAPIPPEHITAAMVVLLLIRLFRHGHCALHTFWHFWRSCLHLLG